MFCSYYTNLWRNLTLLLLHWLLGKIASAVEHLWSTWNTYHHLMSCHKIHSPYGTKMVAECRLNLFPLHCWEKRDVFKLITTETIMSYSWKAKNVKNKKKIKTPHTISEGLWVKKIRFAKCSLWNTWNKVKQSPNSVTFIDDQ